MKNKKYNIIFLGIFGVIFSACTSNMETNPVPVRKVYTEMMPISTYENKYEIVLGIFGDSLSRYTAFKYPKMKDIPIEIYDVSNKTSDGKIPISSHGILIEGVNKLVATSGNLLVAQDIMRHTDTLTEAADYEETGSVPRVLRLEGSIDRSDLIYSKTNSFSGDGTMTHKGDRGDFGFELQDKDNIREIALSLRFINKRKGRRFNSFARYGSATNSIRVAKKTDGSGYGVFLLGSGITNNNIKTITPGVHQAIEILIQHTLIQTFGRNFEVPYWHCSNIYKIDTLQKSNMRLDWNRKNTENKFKLLQIALNMYGFSIKIDGKNSKKMNLALKSIANKLGIDGSKYEFEYYFNIYNNMPFANFTPKNFNALKADIYKINNGKLPKYTEVIRTEPTLPKNDYTLKPDAVIVGGHDGVKTIYRIDREPSTKVLDNSRITDEDRKRIRSSKYIKILDEQRALLDSLNE